MMMPVTPTVTEVLQFEPLAASGRRDRLATRRGPLERRFNRRGTAVV
jgi:hypothetical protein